MNQQEVLQLGQDWADAERRMDAAALDRMLAGDFVGIGPLGFVLNREQWLDRYRSGTLRNSAFEWQVDTVREYDATAIAVGIQTQETSYQGHDSSGRYRVTQVYVQQGGRWLIASIHLSGPMPPAPPA